MKRCLSLAALLLALASASVVAQSGARKPLPDRVNDFVQKYDTEEKVTERLAAWIKEEPQTPEPYVLAANAYLKLGETITINPGKPATGSFPLVDPKTNQQVGAINSGPSSRACQLALGALTTAATKFPRRLDIHVGRITVAQDANDIPALLAAGLDLVKAAQSEGDKMRWIDDAPLPAPLEQKAPDELQSHIAWLYQKESDQGDKAAHALALEALKIAPANVELLNDAALYHLYREEWAAAKPYLERAEKSDPKDLVVKHNLARTFLALGDKKLAREKWQEIIKLSPRSDEAKQAQEWLSKMKADPKAR